MKENYRMIIYHCQIYGSIRKGEGNIQMKYKRVITALLLIVCAAAAGGTGFLYGQNRAARGTDMETGAVIYESQPEESTRIAVVNLDEGTGENGARSIMRRVCPGFPVRTLSTLLLRRQGQVLKTGHTGRISLFRQHFPRAWKVLILRRRHHGFSTR